MSILNCHGVEFWALALNDWKWVTGSIVYMFCRREWDGSRTILYVGESGDGAQRIAKHKKWDRALTNGMNEVHVHLFARTRSERLRIETYLRNQFQPLLNEQETPSFAPGLGALSAYPSTPRNRLAGLGLLGSLGAPAGPEPFNHLMDWPR